MNNRDRHLAALDVIQEGQRSAWLFSAVELFKELGGDVRDYPALLHLRAFRAQGKSPEQAARLAVNAQQGTL